MNKMETTAKLKLLIAHATLKMITSGDKNRFAKEIARIGMYDDEFALALKLAVIRLDEDQEAIRVRDRLIGYVLKNVN